MKIRAIKNFIKNEKVLYWLAPYLGLLIFHLLSNNYNHLPYMVADEYIQLSYARYFAGINPIDILANPFANFGYGLLISPIFVIFHNPAIIYKAILVFNAFLSSVLYLLLYYIIRQLFNVEKKAAFLISFVACLYPAIFVHANFAWPESAVLVSYSATVASLIYFLKNKSYVSAGILSLVLGFSYSVHLRLLPVVILALLFIFILALLKKITWPRALIIILVTILLVILVALVNKYLAGIIFSEVIHYSTVNLIKNFFAQFIINFKNIIVEASGQLFYIIISSFGLFVLALSFILSLLYKNTKLKFKKIFGEDKYIILLFIFLSSLLIFLVSLLIYFYAADNDMLRPDHLFMGRYNEVFIPLYIAIALYSLYVSKSRKYYFLLLFVIYLAIIIILGVNLDVPYMVWVWQNISGFLWMLVLGNDSIMGLVISASIFFVISSFILYTFFYKNFIYGLVVLSIFFGMTISIYNQAIDYDYNTIVKTPNLINNVSNLSVNEFGYEMIRDLYYDEKYRSCPGAEGARMFAITFLNYYNLQYIFPEKSFDVFWTKDGQMPDNEYVIASRCWLNANKVSAQPIMKDYGEAQILWKLPD